MYREIGPHEKVVYRGHMHVVYCDGEVHRGRLNMNPEMAAAHGWEWEQFQCKCFCQDPEYLAHGFSSDIECRYLGRDTSAVAAALDFATRNPAGNKDSFVIDKLGNITWR